MAVLSSKFESPEQRSYQNYFIITAVFREEKRDTSRATQKVTEIPMNRSQLSHDPGKGCDH